MSHQTTTNSAASQPLSRAESARTAAIERRAARRVALTENAELADCGPCLHALEHGWWGPLPSGARTHCWGCHLSWKSLRQAHCTVCCAHFTSPGAFDRHQRGGVCLDPATAVLADGRRMFADRSRSGSPVWGVASYGERPAHWGSEEPSH